MSILEAVNDPSNQTLQLSLLIFAGLRVYLEIIQFNFERLPLTKTLAKNEEHAKKFHRWGLYVSIGFILTLAPQFL